MFFYKNMNFLCLLSSQRIWAFSHFTRQKNGKYGHSINNIIWTGLEIKQKILAAKSTSERIDLIEAFLFNRLTDTKTIDQIIKSTVDTILTARGKIVVD